MRNPALEAFFDPLIGEWTLTLTNAWFLESMDVRQSGRARFGWVGGAFVELVAWLEQDAADPEPTWHWLFGRNDARDELVALYHDPRPTSRVFAMTVGDDGSWVMSREDPDFHQRLVATVHASEGRIDSRAEASDDGGATWRKDFDLIFERAG